MRLADFAHGAAGAEMDPEEVAVRKRWWVAFATEGSESPPSPDHFIDGVADGSL